MRSVSPQASTRRPTTLRAIVPMRRMIATAVRKPSPGTARPNSLSYIGANTSSMRLQKIQRSQAVRKTGTVKKKPVMKRTLNQFFTRDDMIGSRITPPRPRVLITGGGRRVGRAIALALARAGLDVAIAYHRSARVMRSHGGHIVNVGDVGATRGWPDYIPYTLSKAGLVALTRGLATALRPHGIAVNCVAPGAVLRPKRFSPARWRRLTRGHAGSPEDVASAVLFFATCPRYITGQVLGVDGGEGA